MSFEPPVVRIGCTALRARHVLPRPTGRASTSRRDPTITRTRRHNWGGARSYVIRPCPTYHSGHTRPQGSNRDNLSSSEGRSTRDVGSSQAVLSHALAFAAPCISPQFALAGVAFSSPAVRATSVILVLAQASLLMEFVNFLFKPILRTTGCFRNAGCTGLWPAISMECLTTLVRPALEETPVLPRIKQTVYSRCSAVKSVGKLSIIVLGHFPPREEDLQPGRLTCEAVPRNCFGSNSYGLSVRLSTRITVRRSPAPNSVCVITTQSAISRESVTHELQSVDRQVGRETFTRTST